PPVYAVSARDNLFPAERRAALCGGKLTAQQAAHGHRPVRGAPAGSAEPPPADSPGYHRASGISPPLQAVDGFSVRSGDRSQSRRDTPSRRRPRLLGARSAASAAAAARPGNVEPLPGTLHHAAAGPAPFPP